MLEVFYQNDIRRVLLALASAGQLNGPGYRRALQDAALAFGVDLSETLPVRRLQDWDGRTVQVFALEGGER